MNDSPAQRKDEGGNKRKFRCEYPSCGKLFKRKNHLQVHSMTHSSLRPCPCPICPKKFKYKTALQTHIKTHNEERPHICGFPNCGKSFRELGGLRRHEKHHGDSDARKVFQCPSCPKRFGRRDHLKTHEEAVHLQLKPFPCPLCSKSFATRVAVRSHVKHFHLKEKPLKCEECGKEHGTMAALNTHRETHKNLSERKFYSCKIPGCEKVFKHEGTLKVHSKLHHEGIGFPCTICGKKFAKRSALPRHEATHVRRKELICTKCGKKLSTEKILEKHERIVHGARYRCDVGKCGETFYALSGLRRHVVNHVARLKCYFCPKLFRWNMEWETHLRVHTLERPYSCLFPKCGFASGQKSNLRTHESRHATGPGSYGCPSCPKKFMTRDSLAKHEKRVHLKLRPFACNLCGKRCGDLASLKIHISGFHLQEKPYKCGDCEAGFTVKCSLEKHLESRHAIHRRVFVCREASCGKTYLTVASLREHMEGEHGGGEGFPCGFDGCDKVAKTLAAFKRHKVTHLRREVTCSECGKLYASKDSLSQHVKRVHM
ncbi:zinc finger protein 62 [Folsomia candida]|uniref:zinc finger protein 62 n=1 Tax=Folsomia candida TaxID=158441 RepID=UPI000B8F6CC5|nr:zinc finger protein 62 [Folsomia candida]XP_035711792.1 zinc finger protein 62 [Folsomia candida]